MVSLYTSQTPNLTNENDGAPGYVLGGGMYFTEPGQITHARFYATTTVGGAYEVGVYQVTGDDDGAPSGTLLESVFLGAPPASGTWNEIELDDPITVTPDTVLYRPVLRNSQGRYTAITGFFLSSGLTNGPIVSWQTGSDPIGIGTMRNGVLSVDGTTLNYPSTGAPGAASYLVDVVFVPDSGPAEGSAATVIDLAPATTGARASSAAAALGLDLAVATVGSSPNGGSAALTLNLALAAAGRRAAAGAAALGLDLALAASGQRASSGISALQINLAVAAIGSNGDIGCPVPAFPFSPTAPPGYPWTPRPVMLFPGGECT